MENEKSTLAQERDTARGSIQEQISSLQNKAQKQQQKHSEQITALSNEKAELSKKLAQVDNATLLLFVNIRFIDDFIARVGEAQWCLGASGPKPSVH